MTVTLLILGLVLLLVALASLREHQPDPDDLDDLHRERLGR